MNKRTKSFLLLILTFSFIFYSCSNLANDLQKRKNQNLFNITIQETSNGTVTAAKSSGIKAGEEVILTVTTTTGYELKTISVTNTQNKDVAVAAMEQGISYKFTMPASDVTVGAAFDKAGPVDITAPGDLNNSSGDTVYKIEHCQQSLTDTGLYDLVAIQYKRGNIGDQTTAVSSDFPGFTALAFDQQIINSNGNTIVRIYYDRNIITYTFDPNGGNWDGDTSVKTVSGLYGAAVPVGNPKKAGYDLSWDKAIPAIFGLDNLDFAASWAARNDTKYTVKIYEQNVEGGDNYTLLSTEERTGTTDTQTDYDPSYKEGFTLNFNQENINGDGSTVLYIRYDRKHFTVTFDTNEGTEIISQNCIYGQPIQIPENPTKQGFIFLDWYSDNELTNRFDFAVLPYENITLYACWIVDYITYNLHETIEYWDEGKVIFGDFPQWEKESEVSIDETQYITVGNMIYYAGNDGNWYVKSSSNSNYYRVDPIVWQISPELNDETVLLIAEQGLMMLAFGNNITYSNYSGSKIRQYLNETFYEASFSSVGKKLIKGVYDPEMALYPESEIKKEKVFILSSDDCDLYEDSSYSITSYAGAFKRNYDPIEDMWFWLSTPYSDKSVFIFYPEKPNIKHKSSIDTGAVRPVIRVSVDDLPQTQ